jgi:hypothetical protein
MKPTYDDITSRLGALGVFLNYISPFKTSLEAQLLIETTKYSILYQSDVQHFYNTLGYTENKRRIALECSLYIGFFKLICLSSPVLEK